MAVYYDPHHSLWRRLPWSNSVLPRVVTSFEFWLCIIIHGFLFAAVRFGLIDLAEDARVPLEVAGPLLALAIMTSVVHVAQCARRHEQIMRACAQVEEETLFFVQEIQASLGRVPDVLPLRFVASKYSLAATYAFFFTITGGTVTSRGWSEIRAKGLLDDDEVRFLDHSYHGDCMALLHIWAMWAAEEAVADAASRQMLGEEVLACGLARMANALRSARAAARDVAGKLAVPVPYLQVQLHDSMLMLALVVWASLSAMPAVAGYGASAAYAILLLLILGIREIAAIYMDPLGSNPYSFPVASAVNTVTDVAAQLLVASTSPTFNPSASWRSASTAVMTQAQLERRTPPHMFSGATSNPAAWPALKSPIDGDQVPPPLAGVGCCHLDTEALPQRSTMRKGHGFQVARRPTQDVLGEMLQCIRAEASAFEEKKMSMVAIPSRTAPSEQSSQGGAAKPWRPQQVRATGVDDWDKIAYEIAAVPSDPSLNSETSNSARGGRGPQAVSGAWKNPEIAERPLSLLAEGMDSLEHSEHASLGCVGPVSPSDVGPVALARSQELARQAGKICPSSRGTSTATPRMQEFSAP